MEEVVVSMTEGVKDVSSAVLRILTAGVLSGVLIKTGAAMTISNAIIRFWGEKRVYLAFPIFCGLCIYFFGVSGIISLSVCGDRRISEE